MAGTIIGIQRRRPQYPVCNKIFKEQQTLHQRIRLSRVTDNAQWRMQQRDKTQNNSPNFFFCTCPTHSPAYGRPPSVCVLYLPHESKGITFYAGSQRIPVFLSWCTTCWFAVSLQEKSRRKNTRLAAAQLKPMPLIVCGQPNYLLRQVLSVNRRHLRNFMKQLIRSTHSFI